MHKSVFSFNKLVCFVCGLLFFSGIFSSCDKNSNVEVMYISRFAITTESDATHLILVPEIEAKLNFTRVITTTKNNIGDEDEKALVEFESHLTEAEELVQEYKEKVEAEGGKSSDVSAIYSLARSVATGHKSTTTVLRMYDFRPSTN